MAILPTHMILDLGDAPAPAKTAYTPPVVVHHLTPFAEYGARMIEMGYSVLPIMPGTKRPGKFIGVSWVGMDKWQAYAFAPASEVEVDQWERAPDGGICVLMGGVSGLVGADIDTDDPDIMAALLSVLPPTTVGKVGSVGETLFYQAAPGHTIPNKAFNIRGKRVFDLLSTGKQSVIPPTVHMDTKRPYRWSRSESLVDVAPDQLPTIGEDIVEKIEEALKPFGYKAEENQVAKERAVEFGDTDRPHRDLNNHALQNLSSWVPHLGLYRCRPASSGGYEAVPVWRPSHSGTHLADRKLNLKIHNTGITDFGGDSYTPIDLVMVSGGCDLDTAFSFLAKATGWGDGGYVDLALPKLSPIVVQEEEHVEEPSPVTFDPALADELTRVPGLLGDMVDWIVDAATYPTRTLALTAAITVLGTLVGRRFAGPTMSGTHLYIIGIGPSGSGKDWPLKASARLLKAAGAGHLVGPDEFMSMGAVVNHMLGCPISLCPMDEFGAQLQRVNSRKASGHEKAIGKVWRTAWGSSFDEMRTPEYAGKKSLAINAPAFSMLGVTTLEELYEAFADGDIRNGVLNRFLTIRIVDKPTAVVEPAMSKDVPDYLADALEQVWAWQDPTYIVRQRLMEPDLDPEPYVVPWGPGAQEAYATLLTDIEAYIAEDGERAMFLARTAEMAVRLATIRALGINLETPSVTVDDFEWGRSIALKSARTMWGDAAEHMSVTEVQQISNKVLGFIKAKGGRVRHRDLHRAIGGKYDGKRFGDIMRALVQDSELLSIERVTPASGGAVVVYYKTVR